MLVEQLFKYMEKPPLWERGNASMWEDTYIAKQLLNFHIDPNCGMASRKPEIIDKTVKWILNNHINKDSKILDIGCGPGLYTSRLAKLGCKNITGLDFSKNSIAYAVSSAEKQKLAIKYICGNYLNMNFENEFDLITIIFCDFPALTLNEREQLIDIVFKALKPGGKFIFDFYTCYSVDERHISQTWEYNVNGFWAEGKYAALLQHFFYPEEKVNLSQHIIIKETEEIKLYRFYNQVFSEESASAFLSDCGFKNIEFAKGLASDYNGHEELNVVFVKGEKPADSI